MRRRLIRWRERTRAVARDHPFLLSLIVLLLVVIPGFLRLEQIQRQACHAGNEARANQIDLWTYIIAKSAPPAAKRTPAQQAQIDGLNERLHDIFAPRKCA